MATHTMTDLLQKQSLPLDIKVRMTEQRIREWVNEYGTDGVYVSFSGGKDSTVLLDIARRLYPEMRAMFVDVPTQYPELKQFAMSFENVDIVKPNTSFMKVCKEYGFPIISKEVSEAVQGARKYLTQVLNELNSDRQTDRQTDRQQPPYKYFYERVTGTGQYAKFSESPSIDEISLLNPSRGGMTESIADCEELANLLNAKMQKRQGGSNQRLAQILGMLTSDGQIKASIPSGDRSNYSYEKYKFFLDSPFEISNKCCDVMKKTPAYEYHNKTNRNPITAQMACESSLRRQKWLQNGCNGFDLKIPKMAKNITE